MRRDHTDQIKTGAFREVVRMLAEIHQTEAVIYRDGASSVRVVVPGLTESEAWMFKQEFGGSIEYRDSQDDWRWETSYRKARAYLAVIRACLGIRS